jgi:hypothetical protein
MWITRIRPWLLVTILCMVYSLALMATQDDGSLALVTIGTQFSENNPDGTEGYDGQFVYYIARDPSNAASFIDVPAYRFQRILLPLAGMVLSLGQDSLIPWALLAVNLIALGAGTALMEQLLVQHRVSRWYALSYGLTLGTFGAVRLSLPEPLAYGLVLGGILLVTRERWILSAILFALAALAKETALVFAAGYGLYLLSQRRWQMAVLFSVISFVPFAGWQLVLLDKFGAMGIGSGGAMATGFEIIPFMGLIRILTDGGLVIFLIFAALLGPFVIVPTIWGLWTCWQDYRGNEWTVFSWLLLVNAGVMLFVPFSTYREPMGILRFIVGLQIAVILYAAERRSVRVLRNSTIWILTTLFLLGSDFGTTPADVAGD